MCRPPPNPDMDDEEYDVPLMYESEDDAESPAPEDADENASAESPSAVLERSPSQEEDPACEPDVAQSPVRGGHSGISWLDNATWERAMYDDFALTTREKQWRDAGCETTEDILQHMMICQCSADCRVPDCRFFSKIPSEWPTCLPEEEDACRSAYGDSIDLILHCTDYGCGDEDACAALGCKYTEALLVHLRTCREEERCTVPRCWYIRQVRTHWEECARHYRYCPLCAFHKESLPDARTHLYMFL